MLIALIGNQNCGKTTAFNELTGGNQHVGNFPGVTVEKKIGYIKGRKDLMIIDLPGTYSMRTYTKEETVTRDFILKEKPDVIVNIVDAGNLERNLYLTMQLLDMQIPMVLALNMMDEIEKNGGKIEIEGLKNRLGISVVPISAIKGQGLENLIEEIEKAKKPKIKRYYEDNAINDSLEKIDMLIKENAKKISYSMRFITMKLLEKDKQIEKEVNLTKKQIENLNLQISVIESRTNLDIRFSNTIFKI